MTKSCPTKKKTYCGTTRKTSRGTNHKRGQRTFGALTGRSGVAGLDREPKKRSGFSGEIFCDSNFARPLATAPCKNMVKRENKMVVFPLIGSACNAVCPFARFK